MNIIFKDFIRTIMQLTNDNDKEDLDNVHLLHKYRFLIYSIVDIMNGASILYAFYCMALSEKQRRESQMKEPSINSSQLDASISEADSCNTSKIKHILA